MLDVDTFLTALYATTDDFHKSRPTKQRHPGPDASLSPSEVATLAIFARFSRFASERDFYLYAHTHLRDAFPTLRPIARSSIASCVPTRNSSREWPCTWPR